MWYSEMENVNMPGIHFAFYTVLAFLIYLFMGFGLAWLLLPTSLRRYTILLSPLVGYTYMNLVGWYLYRLDLPGTDAYAWLVTAPSAIFLVLAVLLRKKSYSSRTEGPFTKEILPPLILGLFCYAAAAWPVVYKLPHLTTVSSGNSDIAAVATTSRFLKEFARTDRTGFLGQQHEALQGMADISIFGGSYSAAFLASLLRTEPYQIMNICLLLFYAFCLFVMWVVSREAFEYSSPGALLVTLLYALNHLTLSCIYSGFMGQTIAITLCLFITLLYITYVGEKAPVLPGSIPYVLLAVLLNWAFSLTYSHMIIILYAPIGAYCLFSAFKERSPRPVLRAAFLGISSLSLTALLWPERVSAAIKVTRVMGEVNAGWFIPWIPPDTLLGLTGSGITLVCPSAALRVVVSITALFLIAYGLMHAHRTSWRSFSLAMATFIMVYIGYTILAYQYRTAESWGGYKSFKLICFFFPLIICSSFLLFRDFSFRSFQTPIALALLLGNFYSCSLLTFRTFMIRRIVTADMIDLKRLEKDPQIVSFNLPARNPWLVLWPTYFLMKKKVYAVHPTYSGYYLGIVEGQWDLIVAGPFPRDIIQFTGVDAGVSIRVNNSYILKKPGTGVPLDFEFADGWRQPENGRQGPVRRTRRESPSLILKLTPKRPPLKISLQADFLNVKEPLGLDLFLNGQLVQEALVRRSEVGPLLLRDGENRIEFRPLSRFSYLFKGIHIKVQPAERAEPDISPQ